MKEKFPSTNNEHEDLAALAQEHATDRNARDLDGLTADQAARYEQDKLNDAHARLCEADDIVRALPNVDGRKDAIRELIGAAASLINKHANLGTLGGPADELDELTRGHLRTALAAYGYRLETLASEEE